MPEAFGNLPDGLCRKASNKRAEAQVQLLEVAKVMRQHAGPLDTWITLQHD
jgi:hypothetical protein